MPSWKHTNKMNHYDQSSITCTPSNTPCNSCKHVEKIQSWTVQKHYTYSHNNNNNNSYWSKSKGPVTSTPCTPWLPQLATLHGMNNSSVHTQCAPQQHHKHKSINFNNFISLVILPTIHINCLSDIYFQVAYMATHKICEFINFMNSLMNFNPLNAELSPICLF